MSDTIMPALKEAVDQVSVLQVQAIFSPASVAAEQLVTGLGGAIGSDYRAAGNRLVFVEFSGKLSALNLIPSATIVSQGTITIPGTWTFDIDAGTIGAAGSDLWWRQMTSTERALTPRNGAQIVRLGAVNYNAISHPELLELAYGTTPIDGGVATNQLTNGTVFAVRTAAGNYAKAQVLSYGYDLRIRWTTYQVAPMYQVLGTGYDQPEDVKVAASETHAYVTERTGNLLRVDLSNADRAFATVVSSGMTAPHQLVLDEATNQAYVVEYAPGAGRLLRIDLTSGAQTVLCGTLQKAIGLLLTQDRQFAYVSEQAGTGRVVRIRLDNGHREEVIGGFTAPFMMAWSDPGQTGILIAERDPANRVSRISLADAPPTKSIIATTPFRPSSVAVVSPTRLLVCCNDTIARLDLTSSVYTPAGDVLMGIGHVPTFYITPDGYADTSAATGYFFPVKDAPFGGTLPIIFNHERAYAEGARYYKLHVDPVPDPDVNDPGFEPRQSFTDLRLNTSTGEYVATPTNPTSAGYYRVRPPTERWYTPRLGYMLNTAGLPNGLHVIRIRLFASTSAASEIGSATDPGRSVAVRIDNTVPLVSIDKIFHDGEEVGTCGLVTSGSDQFTFRITVYDPEEHLQSWNMVALWGDNQSKPVDGDVYENHESASRKWAGVSGVEVPSPAWTATSRRCAHTFRLDASSRVIDGWNRLHHRSYYKSITLYLP